ncbi:transient receptor potential cation channel subfamily M member 2, partial [Biomphalaria pfeifferi]
IYKCDIQVLERQNFDHHCGGTGVCADHQEEDGVRDGNTTATFCEDDDFNDEDSDYADDDESDDKIQTSHSTPNGNDEPYDEVHAKLIIEQKGSLSSQQHLTLKNACKGDILREQIYKATAKHYNLCPKKIDTFYITLALNKVDKRLTTGADSKLQWSEKDLKDVLQVIVTDFKAKFLEQLLDGYYSRTKVMKTLKKITRKLKEVSDHSKKAPHNFLATLEKADINFTNEKSDCFVRLFMNAIEKEKFAASLYYWTQLNYLTGTALLAQYALRQKMVNKNFKDKKSKYQKYLNIYHDAAIEVLQSCYKKNVHLTFCLMVKEIPDWNESCITIALKTENQEFLQQQACAGVNSVSWSNYLGKDLDLSQGSKHYQRGLKCRVKETLLSPKARCLMDMASYLLFLTAYSFLLVSVLSMTKFHWLETVVIGYLLIFFLKELDQCCGKICQGPRQCRYYITDPFNILDLLSIFIAVASWALRWLAYAVPREEWFVILTRYLLCLNYMLYMFRFLEFFYQNKFLGPMLVVIRNMVKTYINFLLILLIFLTTYCVVSESLLHPEQELTTNIFYKVFHKGFWAMMGEYYLDDINTPSPERCKLQIRNKTECPDGLTNTSCDSLYSSNYTLVNRKGCPTKHGRYMVPFLLGVYVLFIQLLMFNLVIALFNNAISDNDTKRDMIWRYQRFQLTMQYSEMRILLPPFLFLFFFLREMVGNPFKSSATGGDMELRDFERIVAQKTLDKITKGRRGPDVSGKKKKKDLHPNVSDSTPQYTSTRL